MRVLDVVLPGGLKAFEELANRKEPCLYIQLLQKTDSDVKKLALQHFCLDTRWLV